MTGEPICVAAMLNDDAVILLLAPLPSSTLPVEVMESPRGADSVAVLEAVPSVISPPAIKATLRPVASEVPSTAFASTKPVLASSVAACPLNFAVILLIVTASVSVM